MGDIGSRGVAASHPVSLKKAWQTETNAIRHLLEQEGKPWAQAHPLRHAFLRGLSRTDRQVEVLECVLLLRCRAANLSPEDPAQLTSARRGLKWDVSQNVTTKQISMFSHTDLACTCTGALVYSFELDRILHPEEMLQATGWIDARTGGLSMSELTDLLGEAQALPSLAVATLSLLLVAGSQLPGVWSA